MDLVSLFWLSGFFGFLCNVYYKGNVGIFSNGRNHPNSKKIEVTDLELDTKTVYNSIGAAAKALNINHGVITGYFRQNQQKPYKRRYIFSISKIDS
jgi:hypothetical protein